jgi:hypothetical protein
MKRFFLAITLLCTPVLLQNCKVNYSFTGISTDAETVSIQYFPSVAPLAPPTYSQAFTESLKDIFLQQTNIALVENNGELQFEGEIVGYNNAPVAVQGNEQAALNRLTITVNVRFTNTLNEEDNFEKRFSKFEDYESTASLKQVEDQLTEDINKQLTQDILQKAIGNW